MNKIAILIIALIIGGFIGFNFRGNAATEPQKSASEEMSASTDEIEKDSKEWKIQNAMSAAPEGVSSDATIFDWSEKEGGDLVELKKGTNDWTCLPDTPSSPGNEPSLDRHPDCIAKRGCRGGPESGAAPGAHHYFGGADSRWPLGRFAVAHRTAARDYFFEPAGGVLSSVNAT